MDVSVDFDKLFICVLNGLSLTYLNISHALQARATPATFEELFEHLLSYEAQMKILVPLAPSASPPTTALVTLASPSLHRQSTNYGGWNHNRSQQSWSLLANPSQYRPTTPPLSPQHPAPPTQLGHSHYLSSAVIYPPRHLHLFHSPLLELNARPSLPPMPTL